MVEYASNVAPSAPVEDGLIRNVTDSEIIDVTAPTAFPTSASGATTTSVPKVSPTQRLYTPAGAPITTMGLSTAIEQPKSLP